VDDIYEFENSEYRLASMQIKAIAYDVVTGISKKKTILKKKNDNEASSLAQKLATISDRIIEITDSLEEELQKLDQIEEKREIMTSETVVATEDNTSAQEKDFTDDKKEEAEVPSQKIKIDLSEQIEPKQEVMEETELTIKNLRYFGSQPWPYPSGIMIGFIADYESGTIKLQDEELSAGEFYSRDNMPEIPKKLSIARQMIDAWLEGKV